MICIKIKVKWTAGNGDQFEKQKDQAKEAGDKSVGDVEVTEDAEELSEKEEFLTDNDDNEE